MLIAKHPEDESQRILARVKGNLSMDPEALAYSIQSDGEDGWPSIHWQGTVDISADESLSRKRANTEKAEQRKHKDQETRLLMALDKIASQDGTATLKQICIAANMGRVTVEKTIYRLVRDEYIEEVPVITKSGKGKVEEAAGIRRKMIGGLGG